MHAEQRLYSLIEHKFGTRRDWYRIHDSNPTLKGDGAQQIEPGEAEKWNSKGWGIFHTVHAFKGQRRKENLEHINAWAIDIDTRSKASLLKLIEKAPLFPSLVVETRNGFHVYWNAKQASVDIYESIVADRLIPYFGADRKAKDMARLLRVPGYYHQKDPSKPYLVSVRFWNDCAYTDTDMLYAFPLSKAKQKELATQRELMGVFSNYASKEADDIWHKIYELDCQPALERLSGTVHVHGEIYTFKRVSSGNLNVLVNGKSTSCFIDKAGRIGSLDNGGPTIFDWLKWYGRSNTEVIAIMKEVFPELWNKN